MKDTHRDLFAAGTSASSTYKEVEMIVNLFPRLESFKTEMIKKDIEPIIRFLLKDPMYMLVNRKLLFLSSTDVKKHLYFKDVNWDDVYNQRIPPPYIPSVVFSN